MLSAVQLSPMMGAVLIMWILSVCVHEFAHAFVAYLGGDRSERNRRNLSDPLNYIHPVTSILLPALFLLLGGIPLPGGAVSIQDQLLRGKSWRSAVSAAGPVSNLLLFAILAVILHPRTGIVDPNAVVQPNWVKLLGALMVLQLLSVFFNLLPIPPLDGFGIIEPYLEPEMQYKARQLGWNGLFILFAITWVSDKPMQLLMDFMDTIFRFIGMPWSVSWEMYNRALFGASG